MSIFPIQLDNAPHTSFADIGPSLPEKYEPPPDYHQSYLASSGKNHGRTGVTEYKRIPSMLLELAYCIRGVPLNALPQLQEDLKAALRLVPPADHASITHIYLTILNICNDVYKIDIDEGASINFKRSNAQLTESTESTTDNERPEESTASTRFNVQDDQDTSTGKRPDNTESPMPIRTISSKRGNKNASISLKLRKRNKNIDEIIVDPGTPASEDSELSSISAPSPFKRALTEDAPEQSEDKAEFTFRMSHQPLEEFAQEAREIIEQFSSPRVTNSTYVAILSWL
ncbi:hypothetical protein V8C35DRAFT_332401 [Trichoderma chlorosporum]